MKFALHFANFAFPSAQVAREVATAAEAAGFDSIFCIEHVVIPSEYNSVYPYGADGRFPGGPDVLLPDPLIWMTHAAALTTSIRFMTGVLILPLRNPLVLAKQLATMDDLSGGRMELGIGVGWLEEEFNALGVPFAKRGKRTDEYIAAMRLLWRDDEVSYAGDTVQFSRVSSNPKPVRGAVPIIVGGHSRAAAKRAGRLGDGYFPAIGREVDLPELFAIAKHSALEAGRDADSLQFTAGCPDVFGDDPLAAVEERRSMGVGRIAVPGMQFADNPVEQIAAFGERVIRQCR
ncbi:MAG: LLM class F420-dependent oxidoreductase [Gammaproteobacteria bacterium]|nr:LLM class F420-dependent oxidoreductase [Gammaproteobacteria bacterium]